MCKTGSSLTHDGILEQYPYTHLDSGLDWTGLMNWTHGLRFGLGFGLNLGRGMVDAGRQNPQCACVNNAYCNDTVSL